MNTSRFGGLLAGVALLAVCAAPSVRAQSNLLTNPGFEKPGWNNPPVGCVLNDTPDWYFAINGGNRCRDSRCPKGIYWASFSEFAAAQVPTVPGRKYYLKYATQGGGLTVRFGNDVVNTFTNIGGTNFYMNVPWYYSYCHVTAASNSTWLWFQSGTGFALDDVLLGWLDEPLAITAEPTGVEALAGSRATLIVEANGGPPLHYQWFKGSVPIDGATNSIYYLMNVQPEQAGNYHVVVSNHINSVTSQVAVLTVDTLPRAPQIVFHPESLELVAGVSVNVKVAALGTPPLTYQWLFNGTNLPGATNATLQLYPTAPAHAGVYQARVQNAHGSTLSLPATISIASASAALSLHMTASGIGIRNYIFDVDGLTRLTGSNYLCQPYLGLSPDRLITVSPPMPFRSNAAAGLYSSTNLYLPFPAPPEGTTVHAQMRVWESAFGDSYEAARAQGGRFGSSPLLATNAVPPPQIPPTLLTPSFNLRAGQPAFSTGRITRGEQLPNGLFEWVLTGAPGFTYLIEKRKPPQHWEPLIILTNGTGTVTFTDPNQHGASIQFYRSRMLD